VMFGKRSLSKDFCFGVWKVIYITFPVGVVTFLISMFVGLQLFSSGGFSFSVVFQCFLFLGISLILLGVYKKAYIESGVIFEDLCFLSIVLMRKEWRLSDFTHLKVDLGSSLTTNSVGFDKSSDFYVLSFVTENKRCDFNCGFYFPSGKRESRSLKKIMAYANEISGIAGKPIQLSPSVKRDYGL